MSVTQVTQRARIDPSREIVSGRAGIDIFESSLSFSLSQGNPFSFCYMR
jgi:hypothetical protein